MNDPKNQHYVTNAFMKKFFPKDAALWDENGRKRTAKKFVCRDIYTISDKEIPYDKYAIEKWLAQIENRFFSENIGNKSVYKNIRSLLNGKDDFNGSTFMEYFFFLIFTQTKSVKHLKTISGLTNGGEKELGVKLMEEIIKLQQACEYMIDFILFYDFFVIQTDFDFILGESVITTIAHPNESDEFISNWKMNNLFLLVPFNSKTCFVIDLSTRNEEYQRSLKRFIAKNQNVYWDSFYHKHIKKVKKNLGFYKISKKTTDLINCLIYKLNSKKHLRTENVVINDKLINEQFITNFDNADIYAHNEFVISNSNSFITIFQTDFVSLRNSLKEKNTKNMLMNFPKQNDLFEFLILEEKKSNN